LLYALEAGWVGVESPWKIELVDGRHGELEERLLEGELDAAFIPATGAQKRGKKITPLGGWGLPRAGVTETALLIAPRRIDLIDGEEVAISPGEEGTAADQLLRALITPYYGISLKLVNEGEEGYEKATSRLVFGDGAVRDGESVKAQEKVAEDIGLAWWVLTGLPMVWEVLCAPRSLEDGKQGASAALQNALKMSQRAASEQASTVVEAAAGSVGLSVGRVKELFARQTYALGANEQKGLAQFLDMVGRMDVKR
jgi:predicted solute-binding protein